MIKRQRLALAISSALSLLVGTGCSAVSTIKTRAVDNENTEVVVHHISYKYSSSNFQKNSSPLRFRKAAIRHAKEQRLDSKINTQKLQLRKATTLKVAKAQQLDNEINALALKLGLGIHSNVGFKPKNRVITRPQVKHAVYQKKRVVRKVVARRKQATINRSTSPINTTAFEREVNRLYSSSVDNRSSPSNIKRSNLWSRIKTGYRLESGAQNFIVQRVLKEYERSPERLNHMFSRSSKYLYFIFDELKRRNMPTELVFLPMVESAYVNHSSSHSGAAGIWKLSSKKGQILGLKQAANYDARLDVFAATRATLTYLQKLNKEFKGDWYLTLAAYNIGADKIHKERAKNRRLGSRTDYWSLDLPLETRELIPRLLAYKEVLKRPQSYGLHLPYVANKIALVQAPVNKILDLRRVARTANIKPSVLISLNSALKDGITKPKFSRQIIIPRKYAVNLRESIKRSSEEKVTIARYTPLKQKKSKSYRVKQKAQIVKKQIIKYHVNSGDNLYKIALKHGTTVAKLMRLNGMKSSRLKTGINLIVAIKKSPRSYS